MVPKLAICGVLLAGAGFAAAALWPPERPDELPIQELPLTGPLLDAEAEISGLAWLEDELVVLPQFPSLVSRDESPAVFAFARRDLEAYLDGAKTSLEPRAITIDVGLLPEIEGYDGFESIAFSGNQVFVTVEVDRDDRTFGILARGQVNEEKTKITIEPGWVELESQAAVAGLAYEAILVQENRVIAFFEAACGAEEPPVAHTFDHDLKPQGTFPVDLQFRLTDATAPDDQGRFWVSNYYWGGDDWEAGSCPLQERFGIGASHGESTNVERLVELKVSQNGIEVLDFAPLQLTLEQDPRNWEGIARLGDRGLLVATDEHPRSMLAFVAFKAQRPSPAR